MPTYTYRCKQHGTFEKIQPISSEPLALCPGCGDTCKRIIPQGTTMRTLFKGDGWETNKKDGRYHE